MESTENKKSEELNNKDDEKSLNTLKEDCDKYSSKLSEGTRNFSYAILATGFAILCSDNTFFNNQLSNFKDLIILSMALSLFTLLFDFLHSFVGYRNCYYKYVNKIHHKESGHKILYNLAFAFFYIKQITIFSSIFILIGTITYSLYANY